jgi:hypothetical protein
VTNNTIYTVFQKEFEDTTGVIRIRKSKKDRQHNGQKKKDKRTNNDLQNTTQKTKVQRNIITIPDECLNTGRDE